MGRYWVPMTLPWLKGALVVAAALAVAGAAVGVAAAATGGLPSSGLAAGPSPTPRAQWCASFTQHLASDLGRSQDQLRSAVQKARDEALQDLVKSGQLTQQQAAAYQQHARSTDLCPPATVAGRGGRRALAAAILLSEYAKVLGIGQQELRADLAQGKTISQLAAAKGMDEQAFRSQLVSVARGDLDGLVKAGKITQQQEDAALRHLQSGPLPFWDRIPHRLRGAGPSPAPSAASA